MNMNGPKPACERCGAAAIVHIRPDASDAQTVYHFCLACADTEVVVPSSARGLPYDRRRNHAALLILVGLIILVLSIGADFFAFGQAEGFGWKQMTGVFCGVALLVLGAITRTQMVVVTGLIMGGLTLLADQLSFGSSPGFGWHQMLGTLLGGVLVLAGLSVAFRKGMAPHVPTIGSG
jgi:uncharacterized membrane protein